MMIDGLYKHFDFGVSCSDLCNVFLTGNNIAIEILMYYITSKYHTLQAEDNNTYVVHIYVHLPG